MAPGAPPRVGEGGKGTRDEAVWLHPSGWVWPAPLDPIIRLTSSQAAAAAAPRHQPQRVCLLLAPLCRRPHPQEQPRGVPGVATHQRVWPVVSRSVAVGESARAGRGTGCPAEALRRETPVEPDWLCAPSGADHEMCAGFGLWCSPLAGALSARCRKASGARALAGRGWPGGPPRSIDRDRPSDRRPSECVLADRGRPLDGHGAWLHG